MKLSGSDDLSVGVLLWIGRRADAVLLTGLPRHVEGSHLVWKRVPKKEESNSVISVDAFVENTRGSMIISIIRRSRNGSD